MTARARLERTDRGVLRWLLAPLATAVVTGKRREACLVMPSAGWLHRYRSGPIETDSIGTWSPARLHRNTVDIFLYRYTPKPGDVVVDVGAGIGEEVRTFSALVGQAGRVVAVEAHPRAVELLRRNVARWGLRNVTVVAVALAGEAGTCRITDDGASICNRLTSNGGVEVRAFTFDRLLDETAVERVDFLKMNIEGAEREVLEATSRLGDVSNAAVSCHDFCVELVGADPDAVATSSDVEALLRRAGFDVVNRPADPRPWVRDFLYASRG